MRFKAYQGARPGIASLIGAATAPGGSTYNDTMRDLAYVNSARASAGRDESEAMLNRQRYDARGGLEQALAGVPMPEGWNTNALAGLFRASENPNLTDVTKGIGDLRTDEARRGALAAQGMGDTESMNQLVAIAQGDQYAPWALNETGRLNTTTGQVDFTPGHGALVEQRRASAAESMAGARKNDAQARAAGFLEVSPGASVYDLTSPTQGPQAPSGASGGVMAALSGIGAPAGSPQPWQGVPFPLPDAPQGSGGVMDALAQVPGPQPQPTTTPGGPQLVATAPAAGGATDLQRDLIAAGLQPGSPEFQRAVLDAKTKPQVSISTAQESAFQKEAGKLGAKQYDEIERAALQARNQNARLDRLGSLLDQVGTGRFRGTVQELKRAAKGVGFDLESLGITDDVSPAEAARALTNELALQLRNPAGGAGMPGALSDQDRQFLTTMVPGIEATPEGRKAMIETSRRLNQRSVDVAQLARQYVAEHHALDEGFYAGLQLWADENPLFSSEDAPRAPAAFEHPQLGAISEEDIRATAAQYGITEDEVRKRLGLP